MVLDQKTDYSGRILIVDDDHEILEMYAHRLESDGFRVFKASNFREMKELIGQFNFDLVLLDVYLGKESGFDCLRYIVAEAPFSKVVVMTAKDSVELAIRAMENGAITFSPKSLGLEAVVATLKNHLTDPVTLEKPKDGLGSQFGLLGRSEAIQKILERIEQIKDINTTVLILGETGTGKELIARALHHFSVRSDERFEAVNCSAIPETLLEAELFGYKRGAFTDAKTDRMGLFQICSDGTLFLDEIGDMPITLQAKVLRVLQEREIRPLGCERTIKVNTRIITATHQNLREKIAKGLFREDLYYRLSVLPIEMPPLREHPEDIAVLVEHFLMEYSQQFGKVMRLPSHDVIARLKAYYWPGNVRELKNSVERGVILSKSGELQLDHILPMKDQTSQNSSEQQDIYDSILSLSYSEAKEEFEKNYLLKLLSASGGNIAQAARIAGKFRSDIYRLMDKHQIDRSQLS